MDLYPRDVFLGCMVYKMTKRHLHHIGSIIEKKGKRAPKRSVRIAFTVVLYKNAGHECLSEACLRNNGRNLGVSQKPLGHASYLIFTEINIGAVLTIDQNMGTRVLGMRDLTYPTGTSTQICRPHSYKKSNHDFLDGITTLAFYPVASLFSGGRGNLLVLIATGMGNLPVPPCM